MHALSYCGLWNELIINKMQCLSFDFVDVKFVKFKYSAGIEVRIYFRFAKTHLFKCKWERFNKSNRYPISENAWNDQVTWQKYYYKLG